MADVDAPGCVACLVGVPLPSKCRRLYGPSSATADTNTSLPRTKQTTISRCLSRSVYPILSAADTILESLYAISICLLWPLSLAELIVIKLHFNALIAVHVHSGSALKSLDPTLAARILDAIAGWRRWGLVALDSAIRMAETETWGWSTYFEELGRFVNTLERQFGIANQQFSEYAVERLSACVTNLTFLKSVVSESTVGGDQVLESYEITLQELLDTLTLLHRRWLEHCEQTDALSYTARYSAPVLHTQQMGRPRFVVSKDQLESLRSLSFTWPEIATLLGVSRTTVYRRRQEYGMPTNDPSSVLRRQPSV